jgi:hypothetical protein
VREAADHSVEVALDLSRIVAAICGYTESTFVEASLRMVLTFAAAGMGFALIRVIDLGMVL